MGTVTAIVVFSVLIIVHEFGHFLAARQAGVRVEKFAIGFGPPLFTIKGKETTFLICLFPLGGFVKMAGDERKECSGSDYDFFAKSVGLRMRIVFAGPLFNYFLAFLLFWILAFFGFASSKPIVGQVVDDFPAQVAGVLPADTIFAVDGKEVSSWKEMADLIHSSTGSVQLTLQRDNQIMIIDSSLRTEETVDDFGRPLELSYIGISPEIVQYDFFGAFLEAGNITATYTEKFFKGLYAIVCGIIPFRKAAIGPLGIYFLTSQVAQVGFLAVLKFIAILSLSLSIINLFPIPVLDGGHLLFFLIEKVRKREVSPKVEEMLTRFGIALLALLFLFVFYSDIKRGPNFLEKEQVEESQAEDDPAALKTLK